MYVNVLKQITYFFRLFLLPSIFENNTRDCIRENEEARTKGGEHSVVGILEADASNSQRMVVSSDIETSASTDHNYKR